MAQPSGRLCGASTRYRVYLSSSPLFCFADSLSILIRLLATSIHLHISPLKASRLTIISRADERHHSKRNNDTSFDDQFPATGVTEHEGFPSANPPAAWLRWLFSLVGTVPAAIQLGSFSGVPGTQILGLMFVCSFTIIELVTFLSSFNDEKKCGTIPEVLGYLKVEGVPIEEQDIRFKAYKLVICLEWCETALFIITLVARFAMLFELIPQIWICATAPLGKIFEYTIGQLYFPSLAAACSCYSSSP